MLFEEQVLVREAQGDLAVLLQQARQRRAELLAEPDHGGVVDVVEATGLEGTSEVIDPAGHRLRGRLGFLGLCFLRRPGFRHGGRVPVDPTWPTEGDQIVGKYRQKWRLA